jgi:hypothetical protein
MEVGVSLSFRLQVGFYRVLLLLEFFHVNCGLLKSIALLVSSVSAFIEFSSLKTPTGRALPPSRSKQHKQLWNDASLVITTQY